MMEPEVGDTVVSLCHIKGCENPVHTRGVCGGHYQRARKYGAPLIHIPLGSMPRKSTEERFWEKVDKTGECWIWKGAKARKNYGQLRHNGRTCSAHRVAYEMTYGSPGDFQVLHRCDNPPCVRPEHLFLGTARDNTHDMFSKGRNYQAKRTHCPQGHLYIPENLRPPGKQDNPNVRRCKLCARRTRHGK